MGWQGPAVFTAFLLVCAYAVDFAVSAYQAYQNAHTSTEAEPVPGRAAR